MLKKLLFLTFLAVTACAEPPNQPTEQTLVREEPAPQPDGCYEGESSVTTISGEQKCVIRSDNDEVAAGAVVQAVALYNEHNTQHTAPATNQRTGERLSVRAFVAFMNLQCAYSTLVEWHSEEDVERFLYQIRKERTVFQEDMHNMYQSIDHMGAYEHYDEDLNAYNAELRRRGLNACDSSRRP